jgi:hypothetical protein|tara:strand:+ start:649 stop:840 length:192 start_codon:yes stop_codon:yes gene_type:complete
MKLLSSYFSEDDVRHAKVFRIEDFDQRPYQCRVFTTNDKGTSTKDFIHTTEAEDYAEDWVLKK